MAYDPTQIQAGTLRHIVSIQAPSTTRSASGMLGSTWTTILTTRASIEDTASLTFKFAFQNNTLASNATDVITIRYPFNGTTPILITPGMQVVFGDLVYQIQAVNDVQKRHRVLILACVGAAIGSA